MPAKATLFSNVCKPIFEFGQGPYNSVRWNPQGSCILLMAESLGLVWLLLLVHKLRVLQVQIISYALDELLTLFAFNSIKCSIKFRFKHPDI